MSAATDLCRFIDDSPTSFHAVRTAARSLEAAGWRMVDEADPWPTPGRHMIVRGGSLVAWIDDESWEPHAPFRIVAAHTDSPNLRVKQHHDRMFEGLDVVALEPYGGPILSTWLDRDLKLAGRVVLRDRSVHLIDTVEPVVRVPNLAIHLNREAGDLDKQRHLNGIWSTGGRELLTWLAESHDFSATEVAGFELMTADSQPSAIVGADGSIVSAPRLDNQATCFAGLEALLARGRADAGGTLGRCVLVLFDHEEVGSGSERGAQSDLLISTLERIVTASGGDRESLHRAVAGSVCASGDMAHGTHPNFPDKHEPLHHIRLGGGPVLKVNQNLRYATDAVGAAEFARACQQAGVPMQRYVHRADLPCGSTIGPASAARTGITTVDFGAPQLAMHSVREMMAVRDVESYVAALSAFFLPR